RRPASSTLFPYTTLFRSLHAVTEMRPGRFESDRIVNPDLRAPFEESLDDRQGGRFPHVIGLRLEGQTPDGDRDVCEICAQQSVQDRKSTRLNSSHVKISY